MTRSHTRQRLSVAATQYAKLQRKVSKKTPRVFAESKRHISPTIIGSEVIHDQTIYARKARARARPRIVYNVGAHTAPQFRKRRVDATLTLEQRRRRRLSGVV